MSSSNFGYHLTTESPWPLITALTTMALLWNLIYASHIELRQIEIIWPTISIALVSALWWSDVISEGTFEGKHTNNVQNGILLGMILFILSEALFFVSFFWTFFHSALSTNVELGCEWPPMGIEPLETMQIPLLNTIILLSSGITITWAHHNINLGDAPLAKQNSISSLLLTVILAIIFTVYQGNEYLESTFTMQDSVYGSIFFIATGFHGLHVIIGTTFIIVILVSVINNDFSTTHYIGFETSAWYFHFVDVVWLFLFLTVYWWGNH